MSDLQSDTLMEECTRLVRFIRSAGTEEAAAVLMLYKAFHRPQSLCGKFHGRVFRNRDNQEEDAFIVFVPRDKTLSFLLEDYRELCIEQGADISQIEAADELLARLLAWQDGNVSQRKVPDKDDLDVPKTSLEHWQKSMNDGLGNVNGVTNFETSKFIAEINVLDPETGGSVEMEIHRLGCGAIVGIDASFLDQVGGPVFSPYNAQLVSISEATAVETEVEGVLSSVEATKDGVHTVRLSNDRRLRIVEKTGQQVVSIGTVSDDGQMEAYLLTITAAGVLVYPNSGDECEQLVTPPAV